MKEGSSSTQTAARVTSPDEPVFLSDAVLFDFHDVLHLARRHFWKLAAAPAIFLLVAAVWYVTEPKLYESRTVLAIDPSFDRIVQVERSTVEGQPTDLDSLLSLEIAVTEDSMVKRVVDALQLRREPDWLPAGLARRTDLSDSELIDFLQKKRFSAGLIQGTRLLQIRVLDPSPERARRIAAAFASELEAFKGEQVRKEAEATRNALEREAEEARKSALASEVALRTFRSSHPDFPVEQDHNLFSVRLTQSGDQLNQATQNRLNLESLDRTLGPMDPSREPMEIIQVGGYKDMQHVSDLMTLRANSEVALTRAQQLYSPENEVYQEAVQALAATERQIVDLARKVKSAVSSEFRAATQKEAALRSDVDRLKQQLIEVKSMSSEFRALQQQVERKWTVYQTILSRLSDVVLTTELSSDIASEVAAPMVPHEKAKPELFLPVLVALVAGSLFSFGWLGWCLVKGLPYVDRRQLEQRLGHLALADWSAGARSSEGPAVLSLAALGIAETSVVHVWAPGSGGEAEKAARTIGRLFVESGRKTLLLELADVPAGETMQAQVEEGAQGQAAKLTLPLSVVADLSKLRHRLGELRQQYDRVVLAAGSAETSAVHRLLAGLAEKTVLVVVKALIPKAEVDNAVACLISETSPALLLVDAAPRPAKAAPPAFSVAESRVRPLASSPTV